MMKLRFGTWSTILSILLLCVGANAQVKIDSHTFGALEPREIGPAVMGGRVMAIDGVASDPRTFYVGAASGGVWKTKNGGTTFKPVFDKHTQSIGAIAIDPTRPEVIWVGTGEGCPRNSVSVGSGVYKSTDGGESWNAVGLADSERIPKIVVHPNSPDTVYVAALGHLWDANEERGLYRTTDGGRTWKRLLYVDENTGCADLAMDPKDPATLYAAMWQFRRRPDFFTSGGPGSGLYKSTDGGQTWKKLSKGLPRGELGRIGLAIAPSDPNVVYAVVEAQKNALYRSSDKGETFERLDSSFNMVARPFYFSHLAVDPKNPKRVYKLGFVLTVSDDGGESFTTPFVGGGDIHPDLHALWIDPNDPNHLILGTDGGVYTSRDRANTWTFLNNLPLSQFYHVGFDMAQPYNVFGGLQDNGSWRGPSRSPNGIENRDWRNLGGGDGFTVLADPKDPDVLYLEWQGGNILRRHLSTRETKEIKPFPEQGEPKYRFNWDTPIHLSPTRKGVIYVGAQYLFRSTDAGESWKRISPDLTTNDPNKQRQEDTGGLTVDNSSAENHCTIVTISESPKSSRIIWVGTDDGNLQVTSNRGKTWKNVVGNVPGLPRNTWVAGVEASHHRANRAYAVFDGHRTGDMRPYVYRTDDLGKTWKSLASDAVEGYAKVIREDRVSPALLFLGTELGLFISVDHGAQWAKLKERFPSVSVRDLAIHPREADLVIGTHGRGIYILDDITPLRHLTPKILQSEAAFLPARPSVARIPDYVQDFPGDQGYVGKNPPEAAVITYYLNKRHVFGDLKLEIYDPAGGKLATLPGGRRRGINRVMWNMRKKPPKVPPAPRIAGRALLGPMVPVGTYTVKLIKGKKTFTGRVELIRDPVSPHRLSDRKLQHRIVQRLYDMQQDLAYLAACTTGVRDQARERALALGENKKLAGPLGALADELDGLHKTMVATREGFITGEEQLRERVVELYGAVAGYGGRPTYSQLKRMKVLEAQMNKKRRALEPLLSKELDRLNAELKKIGQKPIERLSREAFDKQEFGAATKSGLLGALFGRFR